MNFSNIKMLRKILSLVVIMCMMATLFTGCFGKKDLPESTVPTINMPESKPTEPETQPVPTEPAVNENMATVLETVKVRSSPSEAAPELGELNQGDKIEILEVRTSLGVEWGHFNYTESQKGWVKMDFISMPNQPDSSSEPDGDQTTDPEPPVENNDSEGNGNTTVLYKGTVNVNELNVRKTPNGDRVTSLKSGTRVEIYEKSGDWGRISQGWINLQYVKLDNSGNTGSSNTGSNTSSNVEGNGSTNVVAKGVVYKTDTLNIRASGSSEADKVGTLSSGTRVEIYEKSGNWGRVKQGWISLSYVYIDGTGIGNNKQGTVTADSLRIRSGPGTDYDSVGSLEAGDEVTILFTVKKGSTTWGNIKQGWIALTYVDMEESDNDGNSEGGITWDGGSTDKGNGNSKVLAKGIVIADTLNIRKSASSDSDKVGTLEYGDRVEILERSDSWSRIKQGWISSKYVYQDGTGDGGDYATVTGDTVNIRSGPGTRYDKVGTVYEGDEVTILYQIKLGGTTWGNIEDGWIDMDYVDVD